METTNETIEILNDLIGINNDRIAGYERAIQELQDEDEDLKTLFAGMIDESRKARLALGEEVEVMGKDIDLDTTVRGKIYSAWLDLKDIFTGHGRHAILSNCHTTEDAAQKAYKTALESEHLPAYLKEMIEEQKATLKASHDEVKAMLEQEA